MRTHRPRPAPAMRSAFAGFRFPPDIIVVGVRWYLRFGLSYRDVEELLAERGVEVDHVTVHTEAPIRPWAGSGATPGPWWAGTTRGGFDGEADSVGVGERACDHGAGLAGGVGAEEAGGAHGPGAHEPQLVGLRPLWAS